MKLYLNPLVIETFARLFGASALLETVDAAIPTLESEEHSYLEQLAAKEGWEYCEYAAEKDVLDRKFRSWVPTFAAYSVIILLYSIVETQLYALAEHLGKKRGSKLRVKDKDPKDVLEQYALYLERELSVPVKTDPAWDRLQELRKLRNIIVHRGGKPGDSPKHQRDVEELIRKHPQTLQVRERDEIPEQLWISMNLCRRFADHIDGFFERVFKSAGLPNRHGQLDG